MALTPTNVNNLHEFGLQTVACADTLDDQDGNSILDEEENAFCTEDIAVLACACLTDTMYFEPNPLPSPPNPLGVGSFETDTAAPQTNNAHTMIFMIKKDVATGGSFIEILHSKDVSSRTRMSLLIFDDDNGSFPNRQNKLTVYVRNTSFAYLVRAVSKNIVCDCTDHIGFVSFDGDTGDFTFYIDGVDADDLTNPDRIAPSVGTLTPSANQFDVATVRYVGCMSFVGSSDIYLSNPLDFMTGNVRKVIDEVTWTEWGGIQPDFWSYTGEMDNHDGSESQMTRIGTITGPIA